MMNANYGTFYDNFTFPITTSFFENPNYLCIFAKFF